MSRCCGLAHGGELGGRVVACPRHGSHPAPSRRSFTCRRRCSCAGARRRTPSAATIAASTAAGTCQLSATQSSHEPEAAGVRRTGFFTTGFGAGGGVGGVVSGGAGGVAGGGGRVRRRRRRRRRRRVALGVGAGGGGRDRTAGGGVGAALQAAELALQLARVRRCGCRSGACDSASCPSRSLTRSLSACVSLELAVARGWRRAAAPLPPAVGRHETQMAAALAAPAAPRQASIWRCTSPIASF